MGGIPGDGRTEVHVDAAGKGLRRTLGSLHVWGLAVGLVISGEYFGWSYGWGVAGPLGFLVATLVVVVLYVGLALCLSELATAIPDAGGPFAYGLRALGPLGGYLAAVAALVEFLLAPPAIAFGLGSYLHVLAPSVHAGWAAAGALLLFGLLNLAESQQAARFETAVTVVAILELLVFLGVVAPAFRWERFAADGWMGGAPGVFAALPFAIWFFLGIEGAACAVEETRVPERDLPRGILLGILTLVVLALGVMAGAGGAGDWKRLTAMDFPIPEAVSMALGAGSPWVKGFAGLGLFGLVASLNGILFGAARQVYAVARAGLLPAGLAAVSGRGVPVRAVGVTVGVGLACIASGKTADLITLSALGALAVYALAAASLVRLRQHAPGLRRPFRTPLYPVVPVMTLLLSLACMGAIAVSNRGVFLIFVALVAAAVWYRGWAARAANVRGG
jgi:ethanolamine permease